MAKTPSFSKPQLLHIKKLSLTKDSQYDAKNLQPLRLSINGTEHIQRINTTPTVGLRPLAEEQSPMSLDKFNQSDTLNWTPTNDPTLSAETELKLALPTVASTISAAAKDVDGSSNIGFQRVSWVGILSASTQYSFSEEKFITFIPIQIGSYSETGTGFKIVFCSLYKIRFPVQTNVMLLLFY